MPYVPVVHAIPDVDADLDEVRKLLARPQEGSLLLADLSELCECRIEPPLEQLTQLVDLAGDFLGVGSLSGRGVVAGAEQRGDPEESTPHDVTAFHHALLLD